MGVKTEGVEMGFPYSIRKGNKEFVVSKCVRCGTNFELEYDDDKAICHIVKSCKCGLNED